jgi:ABC-type transport system substrate-binding protein
MKKIFLLSLIAIGTALSTTSCVKKCKLTKETTDSGVIIKDAMVISEGGYQIYNMPAGDYHINASNPYSETYEISFDAGLTKQSVNYSQYSILANPCIVKCDAAFERNVTIDDVNQIVNYTIKVTECSTTCDAEYLVENYVLVPAFPDNYTLVLDVQKTQQ